MLTKHKVHKYKRVYLADKKKIKLDKAKGKIHTPVWKCMLPNCQHYLFTEQMVGKISECWKCKNPFEIKRIHLERVKPTCSNCRGELKKKLVSEDKKKDIESVLENLIGGLNLDLEME